MDGKVGKIVTLKEENSDIETQKSNHSHYTKNKRHFNARKPVSSVNDVIEEGEKQEETTNFLKKRTSNKIKSGDDNVFFNIVVKKVESNDKNMQRRKNLRLKSKSQVEFSLKLSNISFGVRIRNLKNALLERGIKPNKIIWLGHSSIYYLHFNQLRKNSSLPDEPIQVDSIMANLQQLCIGVSNGNINNFITVKPAKPITRIEVTDVSSV